jgi:plasmid rolling circle replication initiator protein Rep
MRSTEVTVNKNDGSYNQHMHVLLCVENAYFFAYIFNLLKAFDIYFKLCSKCSPSIAFFVESVKNMRSTEVTVNKNDGSYNQHMHVLLCVENAYFRKKVF